MQANNPGYKSFQIRLQEFRGIIMLTVSNADARKYEI
jgi:hypothetical protein